MRDMTVAKAREQFSEILNQVAYRKDRMVLTRRGKRLVAVVPLEDLEKLEELENKIDLADARKALAEAKKKGTIPWEIIKKQKRR